MDRALKINRKFVVVFLILVIVYLTIEMYKELNVEFDIIILVLQSLLIGIFVWSIFFHHLKKIKEPLEVSVFGIIVYLGLVLLLALVGYLTYY